MLNFANSLPICSKQEIACAQFDRTYDISLITENPLLMRVSGGVSRLIRCDTRHWLGNLPMLSSCQVVISSNCAGQINSSIGFRTSDFTNGAIANPNEIPVVTMNNWVRENFDDRIFIGLDLYLLPRERFGHCHDVICNIGGLRHDWSATSWIDGSNGFFRHFVWRDSVITSRICQHKCETSC